MKKVVLFVSVLACAAFADPYAKCIPCHGANGEISAMNGKSKIIKDLPKADFIAAMKGYKDGSYGGALKALMKAQVAPLSDADIEAIANKIAK